MPPPAPPCIFDQETIAARVRDLGGEIRTRYPDGSLTLLCILKGSALFAADLARAVPGDVELSFVQARSYGDGTTSSGAVEVGVLEEEVVHDRRVIVVDTILDTGRTLTEVVNAVRGAGAAEIATCVLLDKKARRTVDIRPDFRGFESPDRFLVGYGLDYAGRYRTLAYIGALGEDGSTESA
jgi:hypoxanthine phosphoribosyltransferase